MKTGWRDPVIKPLNKSVLSTHDSNGIDDVDVGRNEMKGFTNTKPHGHQRRE
jgi:hypothetical protein